MGYLRMVVSEGVSVECSFQKNGHSFFWHKGVVHHLKKYAKNTTFSVAFFTKLHDIDASQIKRMISSLE